jgi:aerobic-type carbon monoxide dehydrogenase small subunit (CoxS/CutS family)
MLELRMRLNDQEVTAQIEPDDLLAYVLRDRLGLIGTKIGCGEGECGACTVLVDGVAVNSCIYPAFKAQGRAVTTIEGIKKDEQLDVIQQAFIDCAASQCGYCTPGMIMTAKALLNAYPQPTRAQIETGISGNLCRCTGYYQIVEAIQLAAQRLSGAAKEGRHAG